MAKVDPDPAATGSDASLDPASFIDPTAAPEAAAPLVPPSVVAQTLGEYVRGQLLRLRGGDVGVLPVVIGLAAIVIVFEAISPHHVFLSAGNLVNLFQQSAYFMVFGMAEIFVLLLGEIDLSIGFVGATGGVIAVQLVEPVTVNWPWWAAIAIAMVGMALVGGAQGSFVTRLRLPSFVVTLAGSLIFNGVLLIALAYGPFSGYPTLTGKSVNLHAIYDLMWGHVTPVQGWIAMIAIVVVFGLNFFVRDTRRRRSGLVAPPLAVTLIKIAFMAVVGVGVVLVCNRNRATFGTLEGVPWVVFIVLGLLASWTFLLHRTRYGRYLYAIGGNPEAARRAGINVSMVRTMAFVLCSVNAGIAGLLYASYLGGVSNNVPGGQLVLYAVGAAVIGGASLFGGRGRAVHGVLGGLVIGGIYNGMYLLGLAVQWQFIVTGMVLLAAVTVDALTRRRGGTV